ncbi:hypothetical protein [Streptomyces montanisoli]|uniref:Uncharacterized protein n=1 Tax=Streptomyces montanisoli TaxID=2798581 RepID=A0A940MJK6_9ACTN|nr:hypothetical protein [Streptomyces montanisoli]MBP0461381.1 hypothetical protein [Streptomyces montanisoli]
MGLIAQIRILPTRVPGFIWVFAHVVTAAAAAQQRRPLGSMRLGRPARPVRPVRSRLIPLERGRRGPGA